MEDRLKGYYLISRKYDNGFSDGEAHVCFGEGLSATSLTATVPRNRSINNRPGVARENRPGFPGRKRQRPVPLDDLPARQSSDNLVAPNDPQRPRPVVRQERPRLTFRQFVDGTMAGLRNLFPRLTRRNFHRSARDVQVSPPDYSPPDLTYDSGTFDLHPDPIYVHQPSPSHPTVQVTVNVYNDQNPTKDKDAPDEAPTHAPEYDLTVTHHTNHSFSVTHTPKKTDEGKGQSQQTLYPTTEHSVSSYVGNMHASPSNSYSVRRSDVFPETEWHPERHQRSEEILSPEQMQFGAQSLDMIYGYYFGDDNNGQIHDSKPLGSFRRQHVQLNRNVNDRQDVDSADEGQGYKDGFLHGFNQGFESGVKVNGNRGPSNNNKDPNHSHNSNPYNTRGSNGNRGSNNNFASQYNNNNNPSYSGQVSSSNSMVSQFSESGGEGTGTAGCGVRCLWDDLMNTLDHYSNNGGTEASKVTGASPSGGVEGHVVHQQHGSGGAYQGPSNVPQAALNPYAGNADSNTPGVSTVNTKTQNTNSYHQSMNSGRGPSQRQQSFGYRGRPFGNRRPTPGAPQFHSQRDELLPPGPPYSSHSYDLGSHDGRVRSGVGGQSREQQWNLRRRWDTHKGKMI